MKIKIIIAVFLLLMLIFYSATTYASGAVNTNVNISHNQINQFDDLGNKIMGTVRVVGTIISVGALMVMGIRFMTSSVEEKALQKESMIMYCIGSVLLFAIVNIVAVIYDMVKNI